MNEQIQEAWFGARGGSSEERLWKWCVLVNSEWYCFKIGGGAICISIPHSKFWGLAPIPPVI